MPVERDDGRTRNVPPPGTTRSRATPGTPAVPAPAVSVIVLREGLDGLECWMMQRVSQMTFAPGAVVFPGGRVDPTDTEAAGAWHGPAAETFAGRMGVSPATVRQLVTAAARELFEESGILLAHPAPELDKVAARQALESRRVSLGGLLSRCGSSVDATGLVPWCRIITPAAEKRRYDTWFFALATDRTVTADEANSEAAAAGWVGLDEMLRLWTGRQRTVLPPTVYVLRTLARENTLAGIARSGQQRSLAPIHPRVAARPDGEVEVEMDGMTIPVLRPLPG